MASIPRGGLLSKTGTGFILHQTHAVSLALQKCFDPSIFLDRVAPSLFKLTLQLLRGFSKWVMQSADNAKSSVALSSGFFTSVEHLCLTLASDVETMIEWVRQVAHAR